VNAILLGSNSDIGRELSSRLHKDGWSVWGWSRGCNIAMYPSWSLLICAIGTLKPVNKFFDIGFDAWRDGFESNVLEPLRLVHALYPTRTENAAICFFGGTNPFKANPRYSAYASSKAALRMATRDIAAEYPELRIFMLDTGVVDTKIHQEPHNRTETTSHDQIHGTLMKCLAAPKVNVSGLSFYVPNICR
jgi:NAD(P)-dependent dehydrogenase (short-subunit alcohol dehydrogenase family)